MTNNCIHIALATDDNYARHAGVVITSVLANASEGESHHFHVFTLGLSDLNIANLHSLVSSRVDRLTIHLVDIGELRGFPESTHTLNAYLRLKIPDLLTGLRKILYLDSDLVVMDSLRELWELDLEDSLAGATFDSMYFFRGEATEYWKEVGLPEGVKYFNSGVLLMNLEAWRKEDAFEQLSVHTKTVGSSNTGEFLWSITSLILVLPVSSFLRCLK